MKKFLSVVAFFFCIILFIFNIHIVRGFGFSPLRIIMDVEPGEHYNITLTVYENNLVEKQNYSIQIVSFEYNETGTRIYDIENKETYLYDAKSWVSVGDSVVTLQPSSDGNQSSAKTVLKINVPRDAQQGTYKAAIFVTQGDVESGQEATGVSLSYRVIGYMLLTVRGDAQESLVLTDFNIDEKALTDGSIVFNTTVKNNSVLIAAPIGAIVFFDENGNQVKNISAQTEIINGEVLTKGLSNELLFNPTRAVVHPNLEKTYQTKLENPRLKIGKYTAKLAAFYGSDNLKLEGNADFEILNEIAVDVFTTDRFHLSMPVIFKAVIVNRGSKMAELTGDILIKNVFGGIKDRIIIPSDNLKILPGSSIQLSGDYLKWDSPFVFGYYTATLNLNSGELHELITSKISFWVINWMQAIILIVIVALMVFVGVRLTKGYIKLKNKVETLDKSK